MADLEYLCGEAELNPALRVSPKNDIRLKEVFINAGVSLASGFVGGYTDAGPLFGAVMSTPGVIFLSQREACKRFSEWSWASTSLYTKELFLPYSVGFTIGYLTGKLTE